MAVGIWPRKSSLGARKPEEGYNAARGMDEDRIWLDLPNEEGVRTVEIVDELGVDSPTTTVAHGDVAVAVCATPSVVGDDQLSGGGLSRRVEQCRTRSHRVNATHRVMVGFLPQLALRAGHRQHAVGSRRDFDRQLILQIDHRAKATVGQEPTPLTLTAEDHGPNALEQHVGGLGQRQRQHNVPLTARIHLSSLCLGHNLTKPILAMFRKINNYLPKYVQNNQLK